VRLIPKSYGSGGRRDALPSRFCSRLLFGCRRLKASLLVCPSAVGGDDAVAATPLQPATARPSTAPKARGAQPHKPQQPSGPVGRGSSGIGDAHPAVRPPTELGVIWVASIKPPSPPSSVARARPSPNLRQLLGKQEDLPLESRHSQIGAPETSSCPFPATRRPQTLISPDFEPEPAPRQKDNVGFAAWPKGPARVAI
jgi:hypothetical protein